MWIFFFWGWRVGIDLCGGEWGTVWFGMLRVFGFVLVKDRGWPGIGLMGNLDGIVVLDVNCMRECRKYVDGLGWKLWFLREEKTPIWPKNLVCASMFVVCKLWRRKKTTMYEKFWCFWLKFVIFEEEKGIGFRYVMWCMCVWGYM